MPSIERSVSRGRRKMSRENRQNIGREQEIKDDQKEILSQEFQEIESFLLAEKEEGNLKEILKQLISKYSEYILIIKKNEISYNRLKSFIDEIFRDNYRIKALLQGSLPSISQENISEINDQLETNFRLILANLLLSNKEITKTPQSEDFKKINNFINEKLSIYDLIFLNDLIINKPKDSAVPHIREISIKLNNENIFSYGIEWNIQEYWQPYLIIALTKRIKDKENLENYLKNVIDYYNKNLKQLRENLMQSEALRYQVTEELRSELGREPTEEEINNGLKAKVDKIIEDLEKAGKINIDEIMRANPEQLSALSEYFESFNKQFEEAIKSEKSFDFKKFLSNWAEKLKDILTMMGVGLALWGVFFAFLLPVYFVQNMLNKLK